MVDRGVNGIDSRLASFARRGAYIPIPFRVVLDLSPLSKISQVLEYILLEHIETQKSFDSQLQPFLTNFLITARPMATDWSKTFSEIGVEK